MKGQIPMKSHVWQQPDGRWCGQHGEAISQPFTTAAAAWAWLDRRVGPWRSLGDAAAAVVSKFAIMVTERSGNTVELCRVGTNPETIAKGARRKRWRGQPRYRSVEIRELTGG
jgi:hypothetical protein